SSVIRTAEVSTPARPTATPCNNMARDRASAARDLLGQRGRRELLCHPQNRADLPPRMAHAALRPSSNLRLHRRLVQPVPASLHASLPSPPRYEEDYYRLSAAA